MSLESSNATLTQNEAQSADVIRKSPVSRTISDTTTACTNRKPMSTEPRSKSVTFYDRPDVELVRKRKLQRTPTPYWEHKDISPTIESIESSFDEDASAALVSSYNSSDAADVFGRNLPPDILEETAKQMADHATIGFGVPSSSEGQNAIGCVAENELKTPDGSASCTYEAKGVRCDDADRGHVEKDDESNCYPGEITTASERKSESKLGVQHNRINWLFGLFRGNKNKDGQTSRSSKKEQKNITENIHG